MPEKKVEEVIPPYIERERYKEVIAEEKKRLALGENDPVSGFAISGGGIRSASFGLGVMQALVANDQLHKIDYMSTVSGGGYLGSALTWALHKDPGAGTSRENFPLGRKGAADTAVNRRLNFIRQHSNYLLPDNSVGPISFGAIVMRSMLLSGIVYTAILTVVMALLQIGRLFDSFDVGEFLGMSRKIPVEGIFLPISIALIGVFVASSFLYSLGTFFNSTGAIRTYLTFIRGQQAIGVLWKLIITFLVIGSLPYVYALLERYGQSETTAGGSTLFGTLVGVWQYMKAQKKESSSGVMSDLVIYAGAIALIYGLLLFAFIAGKKYIDGNWVRLVILSGTTLVLGLCVSLNQVGPHRVWRNRLMEAFMPDEDAVDQNKWKPATGADTTLMKDMCAGKNVRPYHIVNTNIILVDSPAVKFRGRGGDNFIISPLYCGSNATGWRSTETFQKQVSGITLATAMATSAAALNPNAGVSGEGLTRSTAISILLSVLNLRLGYWTVNPRVTTPIWAPNFFMPGLTSEVTRRGLKETARNILLSDGGHFENLAIYELIRRRAALILLSDGGADPGFNFDDLANAVEKVRVDFGAKISFKDADMNAILGGTAGDSLFDKKYNIAERGYAIATITYADETKPTGVLVYLKLAMIKELPTDIYSYKGVNPEFPHQSTADQFFNEKQFEAYRELGYNVAWKMMESEAGKILFPEGKGFGNASQLPKATA